MNHLITVKEMIERLETLDPNALVFVFDTVTMRCLPVFNVHSDKYISQDKMESRLKVVGDVNLKPGQKIARLSY